MEKLAYTINDLADVTPYSADTIRRACRATDPNTFPPPLEAEQDTRGRYVILRRHAEEWLEAIQEQARRRTA